MSLVNLHSQLLNLTHLCNRCALHIRTDMLVAGYEEIKTITSTISTLFDTLSSSEYHSAGIFKSQLIETLKQIIDAQQASCNTLLADVLEDTLIPLITDFNHKICEQLSIEDIDFTKANMDAISYDALEIISSFLNSDDISLLNEVTPVLTKSCDITFSIRSKGFPNPKYAASCVNPYREGLLYISRYYKDCFN